MSNSHDVLLEIAETIGMLNGGDAAIDEFVLSDTLLAIEKLLIAYDPEFKDNLLGDKYKGWTHIEA